MYLCAAWTHFSSTNRHRRPAHTVMLISNAAMPVVWHGGLLPIPSCRSIQHSAAGPPPGKQMAGNNTVTHPEHWHPGPGLSHALCYLCVCIAFEIPPTARYPRRPIVTLGDIHEWNWLESWSSLAKHKLLFYEYVCSVLFEGYCWLVLFWI